MLIEFYGKECPHCLKMADLVMRLKKEVDVDIEQRDFAAAYPFLLTPKTENFCAVRLYTKN